MLRLLILQKGWYSFIPKIPILVFWLGIGGKFGIFYGPLVYFMAHWYNYCPFGIFYGHLVYFMVIWYILWSFGIFYSHLVYFTVIWYILRSFGILVHSMWIQSCKSHGQMPSLVLNIICNFKMAIMEFLKMLFHPEVKNMELASHCKRA
jgi:hypothetical protein